MQRHREASTSKNLAQDQIINLSYSCDKPDSSQRVEKNCKQRRSTRAHESISPAQPISITPVETQMSRMSSRCSQNCHPKDPQEECRRTKIILQFFNISNSPIFILISISPSPPHLPPFNISLFVVSVRIARSVHRQKDIMNLILVAREEMKKNIQ